MTKRAVRILGFAALVLLVTAALAGCGPRKTSIDVELTQDYHINLSQNTARVGEVTFNIQNTATDVEHEFVIVKTDLSPDAMPTDEAGDVPEDQITIVTEQEAIKPGDSATLVVTLEAGHYVLMCNLPGHFHQGMHAELTVQ